VLGQDDSPYIPQGASPVLTTNVPNIDFQWGSGSVLGGPSEDVIVRFTGSIRSDSTQNISFLATADDGTKLYIDNVLVADDWYDKGGGGTTTDPIAFTAGVPKTIELMYYENGGGANVFLHWDQSGSMDIIPASAFTSQAAPVVKTIGAPRNLMVVDGATATTLTWEAPNTGNTQPERYAIGLNTEGQNGWGIATGNVGDANALNTTITINHSLLEGLMPSGTVWSFHIRSDNDTLSLYSENSNVVTLKIGKTQAEKDADAAAALAAQQELDRQSAANTAVTNYENQPITTLSEVSIAESLKLIADTATATVLNQNIKISLQSRIDIKQSAVSSAKASLTQAKLEADAAALIAQQAAEAQAEAARQAALAAEAARLESERLAAIAEAARIEAERQAVIAAEYARQQELARIEAERQAAIKAEKDRLAAEAAAKAEADRLAAEEAARIQAEINAKAEADRIAAELAAKKAEEERIAAEIAKAKAEEEARLAEEARLKAEAEAKAQEEARIKAEADAKAAEEARLKAEEDAKAKAEEDARLEAERIAAEEAKAKAEADAKKLAEQKAAEEAKAKAEAEKLKAEADAKKAEEERLAKIAEDAKSGKELSKEEVAAVVTALVADLKPGESISSEQVQASGVSYAQLPPETPIEVRTSESGEVLVITAEVAANVELVQDPGALLEAVFTDPGAALAAFGSIGADMTEGEREEATDMVIATVVAAGAAINAAAVATGGSTGGGNSGGGGASGSNSPGSRGGRKW
jgi:hypothetical protein